MECEILCVCVSVSVQVSGSAKKTIRVFSHYKKVLRNTHQLTRTNYIKYPISHLYSPPSLFNVALSRCGRNPQKKYRSIFDISSFRLRYTIPV